MWRRRLIIFLVRTKLGLRLNERFIFANQTDRNNCYYFTEQKLIKIVGYNRKFPFEVGANVSLNWLLDDHCEIQKIKENED